MKLTPADIDAIASAVVAKLQVVPVSEQYSIDPPISPAELARKVAIHGKSVLKDISDGRKKW